MGDKRMYTKSNGRLRNALIKNNVINRIPIIVHKIEIIFAHVNPCLYLLGEKNNTETVQARTTYTLITIDSTCCVCGKKSPIKQIETNSIILTAIHTNLLLVFFIGLLL